MNLILMGAAAASRRSSEPKEVTFTVVVGERVSGTTSYRGGGQASYQSGLLQLGSLTPSGFVFGGYVVGGAYLNRIADKSFAIRAMNVDLAGDVRPTRGLVAQVQGLASPIVLPAPATPNQYTGRWVFGQFLADDVLFNNWAPGVTRTVTLRWES